MTPDIRRIEDLLTLMQWRREVIGNVFGEEPSEKLLESNRSYYLRHMSDGSHVAVVAAVGGRDAGCGAICLTDELPSPDNPSGRCAYVMNIYVRREYRTHGIGHAIVRWLVDEAKRRDCDKIYLETTEEAQTLYKSIGFKALPGMMKYADIQDSES